VALRLILVAQGGALLAWVVGSLTAELRSGLGSAIYACLCLSACLCLRERFGIISVPM
jgi:hypothetical protein